MFCETQGQRWKEIYKYELRGDWTRDVFIDSWTHISYWVESADPHKADSLKNGSIAHSIRLSWRYRCQDQINSFYDIQMFYE